MLNNTLKIYKNAFSGLSKESWYLSLVMLINRSGTMVVPFLTIYCTQQLKFSIVQAGTIMALFGAGSVLGAFIGGKITDKIGFYYLQIAALITGGIMFISLAFLETFFSLAIGTVILSMCNEGFRPANSSAVAHYSTVKNRTRSYSLNRIAVNLGWSFGGALGGFFASIDYHLLFFVDGFTNILAALILIKLLPAVKKVKNEDKSIERKITKSAYRDKPYLAFILLSTLFASCFFQLFTLQPVFYKTEWHLSEQFIGGLMALNGLLIVGFEMLLINKIDGKKPSLYFIGLGTIITGFSFAILDILPALALVAILSTIIISFGEMFAMPFMNTFWTSRSNDSNRGEYAALYTISWSVAQIIGPLYGSFLVEFGGYSLYWWSITGICLLTATGFFLLNYLTQKKTQIQH